MFRELNEDDQFEILNIASDNYRNWYRRSGVRGQAILAQDSYEYWVMKATEEYIRKLMSGEIK